MKLQNFQSAFSKAAFFPYKSTSVPLFSCSCLGIRKAVWLNGTLHKELITLECQSGDLDSSVLGNFLVLFFQWLFSSLFFFFLFSFSRISITQLLRILNWAFIFLSLLSKFFFFLCFLLPEIYLSKFLQMYLSNFLLGLLFVVFHF